MAGDWIKIEKGCGQKPETLKIARMLGVSRREAYGLLVEFFERLDGNCVDGVVDGVVDADVDALMSCPGLSALLKVVKWAEFDTEPPRMRIINFDRHNGETSKNRALKSERQAKWRAKSVDANVDATPSTREEKRREEKSLSTKAVQERVAVSGETPPRSRQPAINGNHKATRLQEDWFLPDQWKEWAVKAHHLEPQKAVRLSIDFRDYWHAKAKDDTKRDWFATWRRWVRKECGDA